jgi:hypothetical protein
MNEGMIETRVWFARYDRVVVTREPSDTTTLAPKGTVVSRDGGFVLGPRPEEPQAGYLQQTREEIGGATRVARQ